MSAAVCEQPWSTMTSGRPLGSPAGTYSYMDSAPGLEPKLLTAVSAATMKANMRILRGRALQAMCRITNGGNTMIRFGELLDEPNRQDFHRGREPSVIDESGMVDTPRTKLQPRPVR